MAISPLSRIGAVRLAVADADSARGFYERVIGLRVVGETDGVMQLGVAEPAVELVGAPDAPARPAGTTGLFHLAILLPDRARLADALRRVADAGWRLSGASNHLVSEALYLSDPEGNGIEIYRDRPREEWRYRDGAVEMATLPLDLRNLLAESAGDGSPSEAPAGTRIGHVHLQVADLGDAEAFYAGALGLEVTVRTYPGALFLSAGGYHHHVGLNTWAGDGAPPPPPGSRGLRRFELEVPATDELDRIEAALRDAGADTRCDAGRLVTVDPSGNGVLVRAASR